MELIVSRSDLESTAVRSRVDTSGLWGDKWTNIHTVHNSNLIPIELVLWFHLAQWYECRLSGDFLDASYVQRFPPRCNFRSTTLTSSCNTSRRNQLALCALELMLNRRLIHMDALHGHGWIDRATTLDHGVRGTEARL